MPYACISAENDIMYVFVAPGERDAVFLRHIIGIEWPDQKKV